MAFKLITDCKSEEEALKVFEERVMTAMKPPAMMNLERIQQYIFARGAMPQAFPQERMPRMPQVNPRVNLGG